MDRIRKSVSQLAPYVPGEQPKVEGLIKLNTNENPYPPSPRVADALRAIADAPADLRLYPDPNATALRRRLGELHGTDPDRIFVGNGSDEVLRLVVRAFTQTGGRAAMFDPTYSLYPVLCAAEEIAVSRVPLAPDFSWRDPLPLLPPDASLFFLTNPNAPTGHLFPKDAIRRFCEPFPGIVVIDEAYADFAGSTCADLALALPNVLVCRTLSKAHSLAGLRLGWLIGQPPLMEALYAIKDSYNVDRIAQAVACAALDDPAWMRANVARIVATRERLAATLRSRGWTVFDSATNFLWASPPPPQRAGDVFRTLRERAVVVRYWSGPRLCDYLRITIGTDEQVDRLLAALP